MTTAATSLLGLALPVTGELQGTWGDTVNNSITSLLDTAVAGTTTLSTDGDVTLTTTTLASNQARQAILLCLGARTALRTITAPAQSKIYTIINATTGGFSVKLVGVGPTTGLTIPNGASAVVAWNGSDFIEIGSSTVGNLTVNGNLTVTGTSTLTGAATLTANPTLSAGTANGVAYLNGSKVVTTGSALAFDGSKLDVAGNVNITGGGTSFGNGLNLIQSSVSNNRWGFIPSGGALYLGKTTDAWSSNSVVAVFDSSGNLGLGVTPSAWASSYKALQIKGISIWSPGSLSTYLSTNLYSDGTNRIYINNGYATEYTQVLGQHQWFTAASGTAGNAITFTQAMTLDASGRLLIGNTTNSNGEALQIDANGVGSTLYTALFRNTSTSTSVYNAVRFLQGASGSAIGYIGTGGSAVANAAFANNFVVGTQSSSALVFNTNDTERARIDSSGNLGLGVTPSAWASSSAIQMAGGQGYSRYGVANNAYYDGANYRYISTAAATLYGNSTGSHLWFTAASGTAGNAITFTQAMTLDASGNLGLGTTSPKANSGYATLTLNNATNGGVVQFTQADTTIGQLFFDGNGGTLRTSGSTSLVFGTANTERARIDSSGNLLVGYTSSNGAYKLQVNTDAYIYGITVGRGAAALSTNTALGSGALNNASTTGGFNTALGRNTMQSLSSGTDNVAVGNAALNAATTGSNNVGIGTSAGTVLTTGANNTLLGASSGRSTSPSGAVTTGSNIVCLGDNNVTDLYCADTTISSSDARDKTDVQDFTPGLAWITQLRPVTYRWDKRAWYVGPDATTEDILNAQPDGSKKQTRLNIGFLAQEEIAIEKQFGYAQTWETMLIAAENEDGSAYGLKYERLVPVLVNAIKELKSELDSVKAELATLKGN